MFMPFKIRIARLHYFRGIILYFGLLCISSCYGTKSACDAPWISDMEDGSYKNPVLFADYSDPDVVRVGEDYYMTASSFANVPGLPVLHSHDLVNWTIIGHGLKTLVPEEHFAVPRHGAGVWSPSIRYHDGEFRIYYGDPDFGIYTVTATNPVGPWSEPILVKKGKGLIDPCPLWDDDGMVYLVHAWAKSRSGKNNILTLHRLDADGTRVLDKGEIIINGHLIPGWTTIEGPKFYKHNNWYYIFAPAGGVRNGWQGVFRSKEIRGPYEYRNVLARGKTDINGPHQGAWVDTASGQDWFIHFQDRSAYGRITHMQPMAWKDDWPVMGVDSDGDGTGEPIRQYTKPKLPSQSITVPQMSDEFDNRNLGLAWQWQGNPESGWYSLSVRSGWLRLYSVSSPTNLFLTPNLLTQKFPAPEFSATTELEFSPSNTGDTTGLIVTGYSQAWIGLRQGKSCTRLVLVQRLKANADNGGTEAEIVGLDLIETKNATSVRIFLRLNVRNTEHDGWPGQGANCTFEYSLDGKDFKSLASDYVFKASKGHWVGAKFGIFAVTTTETKTGTVDSGYADYAWFRVAALGDLTHSD